MKGTHLICYYCINYSDSREVVLLCRQNKLFPGSMWARVGWVYCYTGGVRVSDKGYGPSSNTSVAEWGGD